MINNPFDKPFNTWTIDDFQEALKITCTKQNISKTTLIPTFMAPPTIDVVELERGKPTVTKVVKTKPKQSETKDTKHTRMKVFHKELQEFISTLQSRNNKLDVKTIKHALDRLPRTHSVHTTYRAYLEKCNWDSRQRQLNKWGSMGRFWDLTDYNRISNHLKYLKGFTREFSHKAKHGWMGGRVNVYKNYIIC